MNPDFIQTLQAQARSADRLDAAALRRAIQDAEYALQGRLSDTQRRTVQMALKALRYEHAHRECDALGAGPDELDTSILIEIEAVLPQITQISDAQLANYKAQASKVMAYASGAPEAQRAHAARLVQALNAEQERRKGSKPASQGAAKQANKPASSGGAKQTSKPPASPPEPPASPPASDTSDTSDTAALLLGGGIAVVAVVAGAELIRQKKRERARQAGGNTP